mgnify:CR=1 FL=1
MIQNPILKGFCPDPSIVRAGDAYYIAVSTFEWWPGVKLISLERSAELDADRGGAYEKKPAGYDRRPDVRRGMGAVPEL